MPEKTTTDGYAGDRIQYDYKLDLPQKPVHIRNLTIELIKPENIQAQWQFLKRGAQDILRKTGREAGWILEDLYAALRYPESSHTYCWVVTRNMKALGWSAGELQRDRYGKVEFHWWAGWTIPPRERTPEDDVPGARDQLHDYIKLWARSQGAHRLTCLSARPLQHIGWKRGLTIYYIPV